MTVEALLGMSVGTFVGVTGVVLGSAAWFSGQALARGWRPMWQMVPYALLLAFADRFLVWSLFDGVLISVSGFLVEWLVLLLLGSLGYRLTQVSKMVTQYPWLWKRAGPFGWRRVEEPPSPRRVADRPTRA